MTSPDADEERAAEEAARWLVLLREEPPDAEVEARFKTWLNASPVHAAVWSETADVYGLIGFTPPRHVGHWAPYLAERAVEQMPQRSRSPSRPARKGRAAARVLLVAVAFCAIWLSAPRLRMWLEADYTTATAELRSLTLEDGTRIELGAGSAIAVAFERERRHVRLLKGEAFFEVTPDAARPFSVTTADVEATVLGTAFAVRRGDDGAEVAVQHGRVRVDSGEGEGSVVLTAGRWARFSSRGGLETGMAAADQVASWRSGRLVANDRMVGDIIDDVRRYFGGMIIVLDGDLTRRRLTGVFNLADPVEALRGIVGPYGASVRDLGVGVLLVSSP